MLYTINFTLYGDDNSKENLTRRVLTDSMAQAEAAVYSCFGHSLTINSISVREAK